MKNFTAVVVMAIAMFAQTACVRLGQYGSRPAEIRLYADSCEGDDHFSGVTPGRAKRTIQAAWDALPNVLQTTATIHLAPGIYRQSLNAAGKVCAGGAEIVIEGDAQDPGRVRVTGADVENDNLMRENGFTFTAQGGVTLKGISFDHYSNNAIRLLYGSMITVNKCVVHDTLSPGVCLSWQSHVTINDSEIYSNHGACPIYIQCNSSGYVRHCYIHDNFGDRGFSYGASACATPRLHLRFAGSSACTGRVRRSPPAWCRSM